MKKTLILLALAPFLCFSDDFVPSKVLIRRWSSFGSEYGLVGTSEAPLFDVASEADILSIYQGSVFGLAFDTLRRNYNYNVIVPPLTTNLVSGTINRMSITNSVRGTVGSSSFNASASRYQSLYSLFSSISALYFSGYRGTGIRDVFPDPSGSTEICINVNYPSLVADVLSSTNTLFRQILFSHLSSISSSLLSVDSSLAAVNDSVSSLSALYSDVNSFDLIAVSNLVQVAYDHSQISNAKRLQWLSQLSELADPFYDSYPEERALIYNQIRGSLSSLGVGYGLVQGLQNSLTRDGIGQSLRSIGSAFNGEINDALTGGSSGGGGIAGDVKRLSTNDWASVVTNQLAQGTRDANRQLQDNHDSITNRLAHMFDDAPNSAGRAIRQTADNTAVSAARASDIASKLNGVLHVQVDNPNNIGVVLDGPVTFDTTQFNGVSVPLAGVKDKIYTWYDDWYSFWDISNSAVSWANFYNMLSDFKTLNHSDLSAITNSLRGVFSVTGDVSRIYDYLSGPQSNLLEVIASSITNNWDNYYFKRFRRANEFNDEDDQPFTLEGASGIVFGRGFDEGEYSKLNWFSRVELLLFQLSSVSSATNALESVDIEDDLNDTVDSFNQHGQDFVNASRRVVGLFQLIDGFAASMRAAFGDYSNPVTRGIVLLPAGSWIGDNALVLEVSVTIQNALRLVFQCIWYLSAFVVAWRVVVATWSRVVSFVRWLWSVFDI